MNIDQFNTKHIHFLNRLFEQIESSNIDVSSYLMDHVCWRCASNEEYNLMYEFLSDHGSLFHKSIHNGREISLFVLSIPLIYQDRSIQLIELPAPKPNKPYKSGFEHAEFVLDSTINAWYKQYTLPWDIKNIDKPINPDVRLKFGDISVKFHPYSLAHVVKHLE